MKAKKSYLIIGCLLAIFITGFSIYSYIYKSHRNIASEHADFDIKPAALNEIMTNADEATSYIDKVILTHGKVTSLDQNSVILDDKIQVNFSAEHNNSVAIGSELLIKGRCVGYDDLLELVKIDQATIITN